MKIKIILTLIFISARLSILAQGVVGVADSITTIVQSGLSIEALDVSANQKYALTTNGYSIALWDLEKRRIIRVMNIPNEGVCYHPTVSSWMIVCQMKDYRYYTYDINSGVRLSVNVDSFDQISSLQKEKREYNVMEKYRLERKDGVISIKSINDNREIGELDGCGGLLGDRIALNKNDSLLLQTGLRPLLWDLKNAKFLRQIPYIDYLKKNASLYFKDEYRIPLLKSEKWQINREHYRYGFLNYYEGYFTDNNEILLGGYSDKITRWNVDGKLLETINASGSPIFSFADNGVYRVAATFNGLNMGRMPNTKLKNCSDFNKKSYCKILYNISPIFRNEYFVTGGDDNDLLMGKLGDQSYRKQLVRLKSTPLSYDIDAEKQTILLCGVSGLLQEVPIEQPIRNITYYASAFMNSQLDCCLYLDKDWIVAGCSDGLIGFWKRGERNVQEVVHGHRNSIQDLKLAHNGEWLISADKGGMIRIWDASQHTPIMDMYHLGLGDDYVFLTPDNFYKASKGAFKMIHFVKGSQVLSFDQFDLIYNRPDIILQRLGQPKEITEPYYLAWKKRLRSMGYTEEMLSTELHAPELTIANKYALPKSTREREIQLRLKMKDSKYKLSRLFVLLNGVPLWGKQGKDILNATDSIYKTDIDVKLCQGNNVIEVSCMNEKGVESYREQVELYCESPVIQPRLFIASVGVSRYAQNKYNLNYAAKDASEFASMMETVDEKKYATIETLVLTDEHFTKEALSQIQSFFKQAMRDDVVMLFYAGHGVLSREMDYYLGTYNMDFDNPQLDGVLYDDFESCLEYTESVHRFCFVDACHSGELDKEEYLADNTEINPVGKLIFRNVGNNLQKVKDFSTKQAQALFKESFLDVRWGVGATVLSSAGGMEVALEGNSWKNGLFTWCLKKGILKRAADRDNDGRISVYELTDYVTQEVNRLSNGVQTPSVRQENRQQNFIIAY